METEPRTQRAYRPSDLAPETVVEIENTDEQEAKEIKIQIYARRAKARLPLFRDSTRRELASRCA